MIDDYQNLRTLRQCTTREQLRAAWLALPEPDRARIRWSQHLAAHAWDVLKVSAR